MEVSASDFARMCGVSAMMVCKKIKDGTLIRNCGKNGRKLDTDNPKNRAYLERKQGKIKTKLRTQKMEAAVASGLDFEPGQDFQAQEISLQPVQEKQTGPAETEERKRLMASANKPRLMMDMTIRQLLRSFSTLDNVEQFSKIQRDLSAADEREQKTQERRLLQIPKDFVVQRVFGYMDGLMNQLLDVPEAVCDQVIAVSLAGGNDARINVMHILSDNLTKCIAGAKEHIVEELNALKGRYDKAETEAVMQRDLMGSGLEEREAI